MEDKITRGKLHDLIQDDRNLNKGTERGQQLIEKSLREFGAGRSILLDKNNRIIAGNKTHKNAELAGLDDVIIVETDGTKLVAVKRTDVDLDTKKGREMALADNATVKVDLEWDAEELNAVAEDFGIDTDEWDVELDGDAGGIYPADPSATGNLAKHYVVPPFSVLDTRRDYWQERKRWWLEKTGDLSETRDAEYGKFTAGGTIMDTINGGTSNFDPVLAEVVFKWFAPVGGKVLDPFGGEQTKGVVAGELGMEYHAVEIRPEQVELNKEKTEQYPNVEYYCGDSNDISQLIPKRGFDLCFTSPPYYDLEVYSKSDLSALGTYEEFMQQYENIFQQCVEMLADNAFLVVKVGEIRNKQTGVYRNFVGDNIALFMRLGLKYYNEIILVNPTGTGALRANNVMKNRKVVKLHQNVLVFYKGSLNKIVERLPILTYSEEDLESDED